MTVAAILLAAGAGLRLQADVPKAFCLVDGRTLLEHAVTRFADHEQVRDVVVTAPAAYTERARSITDGTGALVIDGGVTRLDSVRAALGVLDPDVDAVLVHDVARPFVPAEVIDRVLAALRSGADAVVPAVPVTDTIKQVDGDEVVVGTLDRDALRAVQTPQGFRRAVLVAAHDGDPEATDDAGLIEAAGGAVVVVAGADEAFKTRPWDLMVAEALLKAP